MMNFKDLREDIFDIQAAKKIYWLYQGDDFIAHLDLKYSLDKIEEVVFLIDELTKPINLTSEDVDIGSKWKLHIPNYLTLQLTPKQHSFTITVKLITEEEITLFKGIANVNKRIFNKTIENELASTVVKQVDATIGDIEYRIGTHWVNVINKKVFVLVSVEEDIGIWKEVTNDTLLNYVDTELRAASKVAYDNTLSGLQATTIQAAIDELFEEMQFISDTVDMGGFDDPIHGEIDLGEWE